MTADTIVKKVFNAVLVREQAENLSRIFLSRPQN